MLVLVRHGQSQWNLKNQFTGWVDVPLTENGVQEAQRAGQLLQDYQFDVVHTSYLQRAIKTMWMILEQSEQMWLPVHKSWRLNERHYGGLQGLNKQETKEKHGEEQVKIWRRSFSTKPPEGSGPLQQTQLEDRRYPEGTVPCAESLKETLERVVPYWKQEIQPQLKAGKSVLVVAHGNSLRALVMHLSGMSEEEIVKFEFKTGVPLVTKLNDSCDQFVSKEFLTGEG